jgi:hypothetical protein
MERAGVPKVLYSVSVVFPQTRVIWKTHIKMAGSENDAVGILLCVHKDDIPRQDKPYTRLPVCVYVNVCMCEPVCMCVLPACGCVCVPDKCLCLPAN